MRSGVAVSTVHFYERQGLIASWRTGGNQRRYDRAILRRIAIIRVAQKAGIHLKAMKDFLATIPAGSTLTADDWRRLTLSWQSMIEERIEALQQLRDKLGGWVADAFRSPIARSGIATTVWHRKAPGRGC